MWEQIMEHVNASMENEFFQGGIMIAIISYAGYVIRPIFYTIYNRIRRFVVYEVTISGDTESGRDLIDSIDEWLLKNRRNHLRKYETRVTSKKVTNKSDKTLDSGEWKTSSGEDISFIHNPFLRTERYIYNVIRKQWADRFLIMYNKWPMSIRKNREKLENASHLENSILEKYTIRSIFGLKKIDKFISEAIGDAFKKKEKNLNSSSTKNGDLMYIAKNGWPELLSEIPNKTFDNLFFEGNEEIRKDLDDFIENHEKYRKLGITSKRTYCLEGPPGTGKSSTAFAIANYLGKDLYQVNLSQFSSDSSLIETIASIEDGSVVCWEDIDSTMHGRLDKENPDKTRVSFSSLLNVLDGAYSSKNIINIITTNHIEVFDPALLRKGRIDRIYTIGYPTLKNVIDYSKYYYSEVDIYDKDAFVEESNKLMAHDLNLKLDYPMSEFQDMLLNTESRESFLVKLNKLIDGQEKEETGKGGVFDV